MYPLLGILGVAFLVVFGIGARMMLTSLTAQPGQYTHCARCGQELEHESTAVCPKCRRVLTPEMRVTCSRSAIDSERLGRGAIVVGASLAIMLGAWWASR